MSSPLSHQVPSGTAAVDSVRTKSAESTTNVRGVKATLLVAAAGKGSRMGGEIPKALTKVNNRFLIEISTKVLVKAAQTVVVVISPTQRGYFEESLPQLHGIPVTYVEQSLPNGTTGAVLAGLETVSTDWTIVVWADHIGASYMDVDWLDATMRRSTSDICLPLIELPTPYVYFDLDENGRPSAFHETRKGACRIDRGLSDCGTFLLRTDPVRRAIGLFYDAALQDQNFLSLLPQFVSAGMVIETFMMTDPKLAVGVNTPFELAEAGITMTDSE